MCSLYFSTYVRLCIFNYVVIHNVYRVLVGKLIDFTRVGTIFLVFLLNAYIEVGCGTQPSLSVIEVKFIEVEWATQPYTNLLRLNLFIYIYNL